jgi:hypothetical protein
MRTMTFWKLRMSAVAVGLIFLMSLSCSSTSEQFSFSHNTVDEWNTLVDKTIPEQERALKVKKLGTKMIELAIEMTLEYENLDASFVKLNENYNTTREDVNKILGDFLETRKITFDNYRDVVFAMRSEVSAEEWKKLTDN